MRTMNPGRWKSKKQKSPIDIQPAFKSNDWQNNKLATENDSLKYKNAELRIENLRLREVIDKLSKELRRK